MLERRWLTATAALVIGCGGGERGEGPPRVIDPGAPVEVGLGAEAQAAVAAVAAEAEATRGMTSDDFAARYAVSFSSGLGFDPLQAQGMELVQASALGLNEPERAALASNGFVIADRLRWPTFAYGLEVIYAQDLPVFVSADAVLTAVHQSYDDILQAVESAALVPELERLLVGMRGALAAGAAEGIGADAAKDADLYLAVALGLLTDSEVQPVAGADPATIADLRAKATAHSGWLSPVLFGVSRDVDFSQFEPRGHYTDTPALERYFRTMMWLGRVDFRLLESQPDGSQIFRRRQLEGAAALRALTPPAELARWSRIDDTIRTFVGEPDSMTLPEVDTLLVALGARTPADLAAFDDATLAQAVIEHGFGVQRISSDIMINGQPGTPTLPLNRSFLLFGQRYVIDSHVFSRVVFDRAGGGTIRRMMPSPLDVAFAALGNDQAGALLAPELVRYPYAPDLHLTRFIADRHGDAFWDANLYNLWLGSLRELSPRGDMAAATSEGLPRVATTEAWGRRLLSTQLASWAELRHDTILYAKQSYTGGAACEFPDGYVEPYPALFTRLAAFASKGSVALAGLDWSGATQLESAVTDYLGRLSEISLRLADMAARQRTGQPLDASQVEFLNRAVHIDMGCGEAVGLTGWYGDLFFDRGSAVTFDPTIADVHTQPTDEAGNPVGRVLHVATGSPRLMVMTADTCVGPRAYVGVVSGYFERITEQFDRLDDEQWEREIRGQTPPEVPWLGGVVVR